jgi:probable F420-dependent oxidoreductase
MGGERSGAGEPDDGLRFGAVIFPTDYSIDPRELGRALEATGFESFWVPEHTHIPTSRQSPWPGGAELPREYRHTLDPFVALAAVAAVTTTLRLGTGICLVTQRDPIVTAKEVATLDHLSGGRFLFGVGAGWNREELASHGTDFSSRWRLMRERVEAMKRVWGEEEAEYHGSLVDFQPLWSWPKPVQKPHPPVVVGGNGPRTLERVVAYGDEWMPIHGRGPRVEDRIPELERLAAEAGRESIPVSLFHAPRDEAEIERLASRGVRRFIFGLPPAGAGEVLPVVEDLGRLVAAVS